MNPSTWAGTVNAIVSSLILLVTGAGAWLLSRAQRAAAQAQLALHNAQLEVQLGVTKVSTSVTEVGAKVDEVHHELNSRLTAMLDRTELMVTLLEKHDIPVPPAEGDEALEQRKVNASYVGALVAMLEQHGLAVPTPTADEGVT